MFFVFINRKLTQGEKMRNTLTVPIFKREDWPRIKACSEDDIPGSYDDYIHELWKRLAAYKKQNNIVREIEVDFNKMLAFLRENGLANVAANRARYIQALTSVKMQSKA